MTYPPPERSPFRERIGMYVLGIAIGFMILGLIFTMRQRAARQPPSAPPATGPISR